MASRFRSGTPTWSEKRSGTYSSCSATTGRSGAFTAPIASLAIFRERRLADLPIPERELGLHHPLAPGHE